LSRLKIVKKNGRRIKKYVRNCDPWRDDLRACVGIHNHNLSPSLRAVVTQFSDADYVFWILLALATGYRPAYVFSSVTPVLEGRGIVIRIYGSSSNVHSAYGRINTLFSRVWEKWKNWHYRIELVSHPEKRIYRHTPEERMEGDVSIELRIYPPLDTLTYTTCKVWWEKSSKEKPSRASEGLNILYLALEQDVEKRRSTAVTSP